MADTDVKHQAHRLFSAQSAIRLKIVILKNSGMTSICVLISVWFGLLNAAERAAFFLFAFAILVVGWSLTCPLVKKPLLALSKKRLR